MWATDLLWLRRYFVWFSLSKSGAHLMGKPDSGFLERKDISSLEFMVCVVFS